MNIFSYDNYIHNFSHSATLLFKLTIDGGFGRPRVNSSIHGSVSLSVSLIVKKKLDSNCFIAELDQSNIAGDQPRKFHWFQFSLRKLSTWLQAQLLNDQKLAYVGQNFAFSMLKSTPAWRKKVCHRRCWQCWLIWAMNCLLLIKMSRTGGQECWWPPMALISDGASSPPKWHWPSPVTAPWMHLWLSSSSSHGPVYVILSSWHQKSPFLTRIPRDGDAPANQAQKTLYSDRWLDPHLSQQCWCTFSHHRHHQ